MNWQEAFLAQARSDNAVRELLNREKASYSHQLHYLQMMTEKLAKGLMADPSSSGPPKADHAAFVRYLHALKADRVMRRRLNYDSYKTFAALIDSLLPLADRIQNLAPNFAGLTKPNPEYPWRPVNSEEVLAPCDFDFPDFSPWDPRMGQLMNLLRCLIQMHV